jgi:hypothetical protein
VAYWSLLSATDPRQYLATVVNHFETLTWNYSSGLVLAKDSNGRSIFEGKKVTAFSNEEEKAAGFSAEVSVRFVGVL